MSLAVTDLIALSAIALLGLPHGGFDGANYIMDYLKTRAPFWKCEETAKGAVWVDAREADETALDKWS